MKTKGFTLIELLAVIVILAIIALIAVPIIIDIIEDSKKEALKRSAENYLKAVELAIAKENLNGEFNPNSCTITSGITKCGDKTLNVTVDGELPDSGEIMLSNGTIDKTSETFLTYDKDTLTYDGNNKLIIIKEVITPGPSYITLSDCTPAQDQMYPSLSAGEVGYKYQCPVDDSGTLYNFYVLSKEGSNVNLILDRNVYYNSDTDYGLADYNHSGLVDWITREDFVSVGGTLDCECVAWNASDCAGEICTNARYGPVTALTYLYNATKNWNRIPNTNLNYISNSFRPISFRDSYYKIEIIDGFARIKYKGYNDDEDLEEYYVDGFELMNLKARLPKRSEISTPNGTNSYLYDYLNTTDWCYDLSYKPNNYSDIWAYWTFDGSGLYAEAVCGDGDPQAGYIDYSYGFGVRPVITLPLN